MYHVRLSTGIDKLYRTVDEMVAEANLGVVDVQARIYHPKTRTWVPVTRHVQLSKALLAGAEPPRETRLEFTPLTEEEATALLAVPDPDAAPRPPLRAPEPPPPPPRDDFVEEPPPPADLEGVIADDGGGQTWNTDYTPLDWRPDRRPNWALIAVTSVVGVLVLLGGWAGWEAVSSWRTRRAALVGDTLLVADSMRAPEFSDSAIAAALAAMDPAAAEPAPLPGKVTRPARPARPAFEPSPVISASPMDLRRSYLSGYAEIRAQMDRALEIAGVERLFAPARLGSPDSLRSGRRILLAARNVFAAYHDDEVRLERAFRDTVAYLVREGRWSTSQREVWNSRAQLKEAYEGTQLTDSLLNAIDAVYGILLAEWGDYRRTGDAIVFDRAEAAARWRAEAGWLQRRLAALGGAESPGVPATARRLVRATGGARLPRAAAAAE